MFALTVDRRDSRADAERLDMREHLEACRRDLPRPLVAWDITAGDELQALYDAGLDHVQLSVQGVDAQNAGRARAPTSPAQQRDWSVVGAPGVRSGRSGLDLGVGGRRHVGLGDLDERGDELYALVVRDIEKDLLPAAQEYKLGLLPFFPLASGLLTGKYRKGEAAPGDTRFGKVPRLRDRYVTPRNEDIVEKLQAFAQARGHTMLELAFSWLAARPKVITSISPSSATPSAT